MTLRFAAAVALVLVVSTPQAAAAHDSTIAFTVVGDGAGHIRVAAQWTADGHLVEKPVVVMITATSTTRVGPVRLAAVAGQAGVYEAPQAIPPGRWTVTAESSDPALGYGEAVLDVGAHVVGYPADFPPQPPAAPTADSVWLALAVAATLATVVIALVGLMRARRISRSGKRS